MWESGQKTKRVYFWLTEEDAFDFSHALHEALPSMQWRCDHGGGGLNPRPVHYFDTLAAALKCENGTFVIQAFARMALSELQFLTSNRHQMKDAKDTYSPDYVFPAIIDWVEHGIMAIRWNTQDADASTLVALEEQIKTIWRVFQKSTLPAKVHMLNGRPLAGFRIGRRMREVAKAEKIYLRTNGPFCMMDC